MKLLLDTQVFLWWRAEPRRIEPKVERVISRADIVYVSAVSAWEAAIKTALGKLRFPGSIEQAVVQSDFTRLPITFQHAESVRELPQHHVDPFDRLLIAQALCEGLTLVTADRQFESYRLPVIWT